MKKQIPTFITALSFVIAVFAISWGISATKKKHAAEEEANRLRVQLSGHQTPAPVVKPITPDQEPPADTNALAKLEAEVDALNAELTAAKENQRPQRESWEDHMARMKEEDPEGYAEMIKNRTERRDAMRYDLAERTANFMELDTEFMTEAERENHDLLIEKMANVWALTEQFNDPEQQPNREAMHELFGVINEARPLMDAERSTMFRQLANDIGYDGAEAREFSSYVEDIISATTIQPPRGVGPGRHPGP